MRFTSSVVWGCALRCLEAGSDVGGTWYWNRYPGARCDVPSVEYSYSFDKDLEQEWDWTEIMAAQPEILEYANHVADRFDLRKDMQFQTRVDSAVFDENSNRWTVVTDSGQTYTARFCVMATGCLSVPNTPRIDGQDNLRDRSITRVTGPRAVLTSVTRPLALSARAHRVFSPFR